MGKDFGVIPAARIPAYDSTWDTVKPHGISKAGAVGRKTVSTTAAELFAGASRLANRKMIIIQVLKAETSPIYISIGQDDITTSTGFPLDPGVIMTLNFDSATSSIPIYAIATADVSVSVMEVV
jgi:hypothetical protein